MNREQFIQQLRYIFDNCLEIVKKKNQDYAGSENPFKNFELSVIAGVTPERAILVRMADKLSRISNCLDKEVVVLDESVSDSIDDLISYSGILKAKLIHNEAIKNQNTKPAQEDKAF